MRKILNYLWRGWFVILGAVLTLILGIPVYLFSFKKEHYPIAYKFIRLWCLGMFYGMGFSYRLRRDTQQKIDRHRPYIFIANHTSIIDVLLPCILMPNHPLCYVGKKEIEKVPVFGTIYRRICVMVDRNSPKSRADVYRRCAERMAEGQSIVLFPEGGVPDDTSIMLDAFKDGAFKLASQHRFPIAVFSFLGLKEMFPFDYSQGHPGTVQVVFNVILEPDQPAEALKEIARNEIKHTLESYYLTIN